ncbi:MAG: hypothetical protein OJF59_001399 [Cytophagales bacterium]|jgi:hypothetical protein|nr:hypothetical protein [Bacteroidota bacterium]MBS1982260.1 hypothetical protein [Bacteroidota bacterium]WHZ07646.1 MAG: hypothetical protein OJF59_001399 [Cytophagales bacterium]
MKKLPFIIAALFLASCASLTPVGKWDYQITGTPQGDYSGVMTVSKKDKKTLAAEMKSQAGDLPFSKFDFNDKSKKAMGDFSFQGMTIFFDATVTEQEMTGSVSTQGMNFPFKAKRVSNTKK